MPKKRLNNLAILVIKKNWTPNFDYIRI